jgi:predicted phosphodiesterase
MKIQVISDIHLEFNDNYEHFINTFVPEGDILVIAGDMCTFKCELVMRDFTDKYACFYDKIILVPGNHEYYNSDYQLLSSHQNINVNLFENLYVCNNVEFEIENARFICSTMWSGISERSTEMINDYFVIEGFNCDRENAIHENSTKFLEDALKKETDKVNIVVTHHLPTYSIISPKYAGDAINDAFAAKNEQLLDYDIKYWLHGHSHEFSDVTINDTRVIRNPLGYIRHERNPFDNIVLEV